MSPTQWPIPFHCSVKRGILWKNVNVKKCVWLLISDLLKMSQNNKIVRFLHLYDQNQSSWQRNQWFPLVRVVIHWLGRFMSCWGENWLVCPVDFSLNISCFVRYSHLPCKKTGQEGLVYFKLVESKGGAHEQTRMDCEGGARCPRFFN